jgi:hypothetical protein
VPLTLRERPQTTLRRQRSCRRFPVRRGFVPVRLRGPVRVRLPSESRPDIPVPFGDWERVPNLQPLKGRDSIAQVGAQRRPGIQATPIEIPKPQRGETIPNRVGRQFNCDESSTRPSTPYDPFQSRPDVPIPSRCPNPVPMSQSRPDVPVPSRCPSPVPVSRSRPGVPIPSRCLAT